MGAATTDGSEISERAGAPRPGEVLAGKYRVEGTVGTGGMGVVVAAQHIQLGQTVAIKLLLTDDTQPTEAQTRFLREARAAAGLCSDHVVRVYDVGLLENGVPFMVMELLRGKDLGMLVDEQGPLPVDHAVEYVMQACDAIAEAHAAGIVHRDLKPSNLFVTRRSNGEPLIKVLDFGISKAMTGHHGGIDGRLTATRAVLGSPYYMSPEQVRDSRNVDARADVWALGVILHELLTGGTAFAAETFPAICAAIVADPPAPIRLRHPEVPEALENVVLACLEKNPAHRVQSVVELMRALEQFAPKKRASLRTLPPPPAPGATGTSMLPRTVSTSAATVAHTPLQRTAEAARAVSYPPVEEISWPGPGPAGSISIKSFSHGPVPVASPEAPTAQPSKSPKPALLILLCLLAGIAAAIVFFATARQTRAELPPAAPILSPSTDRSFALLLESTPAGAEVREAGHRLGLTPLRLSIERDSVSAAPRTFTIESRGYQPYTIVQGRSDQSVRIAAVLIAAPPPAAPPPASAEEIRPSARGATFRKKPTSASPQPSAMPPPVSTSPDIRLER